MLKKLLIGKTWGGLHKENLRLAWREQGLEKHP